jgi:hypothetical protein
MEEEAGNHSQTVVTLFVRKLCNLAFFLESRSKAERNFFNKPRNFSRWIRCFDREGGSEDSLLHLKVTLESENLVRGNKMFDVAASSSPLM